MCCWTDDFMEGGDAEHDKVMKIFYDKYDCGKKVDLINAGTQGALFAGRRVVQYPDFRITVSMNEYVQKSLKPIEVPRGFLSSTTPLTDAMITRVKGVNGGIGWLATTGRPDMSAAHSIIPSKYEARSPALITEVNKAVKQCHDMPITIQIWPIPPEEVRWTAFSDSGFDTSDKQRHQHGWVIGVTNSYFNEGRRAPVSVLHWRSRRLPRKAGSPQLVETYAAGYTVTELAWMKALWESMTWKNFNILIQRRDSSTVTDRKMPYVVRDENPDYRDPESTLVMDSKGLHDSLDNELPQDDRKSALEVPIITEFLTRVGGRARWVPHNFNPADAMTKIIGAHLEPLWQLLKTGMFTLKGEREELASRAEQKKIGAIPRHKVSAKQIREKQSFMCAAPEFFIATKERGDWQEVSFGDTSTDCR